MQGQLGEKLIADLIREIAQKNASGLLRLSRGKAIKAIFFESGAPVFAISNLTTDQIEHLVIKEGRATLDQIDQAKRRADKPQRVAAALVEIGALTTDQMRKMVRDQVMCIISSLFEWTQGDYMFDERIRAAHDITIEIAAGDVILEGARRAAANAEVADLLAPKEAVVVRAKANAISVDSAKLLPIESYVLSRIEAPTPVGEMGALSGIADQDAHRAVCALVAAGLLNVLGREKAKEEEAQPAPDNSVDRLREDVSRKLHFFTSADFYDVLGVARQSTSGDIKAAYYQLAKKYHPDRYRQPELSDLRGKLETLFTIITQAYDTLNEPKLRAAYDERIRKPSGSLAQATHTAPTPKPVMAAPATVKQSAVKHSPLNPAVASSGDLPAATPAAPAEQKGTTGELKPPPTRQANSAPLPQAVAAPAVAEVSSSPRSAAPANGNPSEMAERYYQQGRARYDRREYHVAVHLFREAVKLDATKPPYHFHLGIALIRNPRTRREAEEHLSKAAELEPYNAQMRVKLGMLYKEAGLPRKADHYFRQALSIDPDNRMAKREMSQDVASKGQASSLWKSDLGTIAKRIFKK